MIRITLLLACLAALPACATWTRAPEGGLDLRHGDYVATQPAGWMRSEARGPMKGCMTLDGLGIQFISFEKLDLDDAFPALDRKASVDMLPSELAELVVAELKAKGFDALVVLSEGPAVVAGQEAFRLHVRDVQATSLRVDRLIYGFVTPSGFYLLGETAPALYYFERDLPVFEAFVRSVRPVSG